MARLIVTDRPPMPGRPGREASAHVCDRPGRAGSLQQPRRAAIPASGGFVFRATACHVAGRRAAVEGGGLLRWQIRGGIVAICIGKGRLPRRERGSRGPRRRRDGVPSSMPPRAEADDREHRGDKEEPEGRAGGHASAASRGESGRGDSAFKIDHAASLPASIRSLRHVRNDGHVRHGRHSSCGGSLVPRSTAPRPASKWHDGLGFSGVLVCCAATRRLAGSLPGCRRDNLCAANA